jgi:hypothetical protein
MSIALVSALFTVAMWYGVLTLGHDYLAAETRGLPETLFLVVAVLLPGGSAFGVALLAAAAREGARLSTPGALVLIFSAPLALGLLAWRGRRESAAGADYLRRRWAASHAETDAALAADPKDSLALQRKARTLEEEGRFEDAASAWERAHAASEALLKAPMLEDHLKRLRMRAARRDAEAARRDGPRVETVLLAAGVLLFAVSWPLGLQLTAYMAFVRWFRSAPRVPGNW